MYRSLAAGSEPVAARAACMCAVVRPRPSYRNCSVNNAVSCCAVNEEVMRPVVSRLWVWVKGVESRYSNGERYTSVSSSRVASEPEKPRYMADALYPGSI